MFVLETGTGKSVKTVGYATTVEEANDLVAAALANGVIVKHRELTTDPVIFKTRNYDSEFKALIDLALSNISSIRQFPTDKLKMGASEYEKLVRPLIRNDFEEMCMALARPHQLQVYLGDYGYGRSIEWTSSNGYTEGRWVSSGEYC